MTNILLDGYDRNVDYLRISITDRCNMRCTYCMPDEGVKLMRHSDIVRYEDIIFLMQTAIKCGINKFRFTGGEPLVRAGFIDFIRDASSISGVYDLSLTTNGVALASVAERLKNNGLNRINISLDSLNRENFTAITRTDQLENVLNGIRAAIDVGLNPVKINTVIMPENKNELVDFAALSMEKPLHVRFIEFMPVGNAGRWYSDGYIKGEQVRGMIEEKLGKLEDVHSPGGAGPARYSRLNGAKGTIGFISPISNHFCASCNRLRMTSDGRLRACLIMNDEIDIRNILKGREEDKLIFSLKEIINRKPCSYRLDNEKNITETSRRMSGIGG